MSTIYQFIEEIKQEMSMDRPSRSKIYSLIFKMKNTEEFKALNDIEYYDIVGEIFTLNPEFFMASLYSGMRSLDMAKHIFQKYCLYEDEKILYETRGDIIQETGMVSGNDNVKVSVTGGAIYVTNYRIIAQGTLSVKGGRYYSGGLIDLMIAPMTGSSSRKKSRQAVIVESLNQELPCYGYQFKAKAHFRMKKKSNSIRYEVFGELDNLSEISSFLHNKMLNKSVRLITLKVAKDQVNDLFNIMCKDTDQTIDMFQELTDIGVKGRRKRIDFKNRLKKIMDMNNEEYRNFSDADRLKIINKVYDLDPELFKTSLHPKLEKWSLPTYINLKDKIDELVSH